MKNPFFDITVNPFAFIESYNEDQLLALARHQVGVSLFGDMFITFNNGHNPVKTESDTIQANIKTIHDIELRQALDKINEILACIPKYKEMEAKTYKFAKQMRLCISDIFSGRIDYLDYIEAFHLLAVSTLYLYQHIDNEKYHDLHKIYVKPALTIVEYYAIYIRSKKHEKDLLN